MCTMSRPPLPVRPSELKAFAKVWLDPGDSEDVALTLGPRAFAFWDIAAHDWLVEPGEFELLVGTSSRDIHHKLTVTK